MPANDLSLRSAVNDLYCDHHGWLNGWLRKRLGNAFDAADLAQDTFVRVIKARNALEIREPRPYLSMIAKGLLIDLIRRHSLEHSAGSPGRHARMAATLVVEQSGEVAVLEKAVKVTASGGGSTVRLEAGQSMGFNAISLGAVRRNDASTGAWQQGSIIAIDRPLAELLADLSRYRTGVLRCDPRIANLKVSGAFPVDNTDLVLAALQSGFSLRISRYSRYWVNVSGSDVR